MKLNFEKLPDVVSQRPSTVELGVAKIELAVRAMEVRTSNTSLEAAWPGLGSVATDRARLDTPFTKAAYGTEGVNFGASAGMDAAVETKTDDGLDSVRNTIDSLAEPGMNVQEQLGVNF